MLIDTRRFSEEIQSGSRAVELLITADGLLRSQFSIHQEWRSHPDFIESDLEVLAGSSFAGVKVTTHEALQSGSPLQIKVKVPGASRILSPSSAVSRIFGSEILYENTRFWLPITANCQTLGRVGFRCTSKYDDWEAVHIYSGETVFPRFSRWIGKGTIIDVLYEANTQPSLLPAPTSITATDGVGRLSRLKLATNSGDETEPTTILCQSVLLSSNVSRIFGVFTDSGQHEKVIGIPCMVHDGLWLIDNGEIKMHLVDCMADSTLHFLWRIEHPWWPNQNFSACTITLKPRPEGTILRLVQVGIPNALTQIIRNGWSMFYWDKLGLLRSEENAVLNC